MSAALPTGTVTFVFTDIEGSTRLVQDLGDRWPAIFEQHDSIARTAVRQFGGQVVPTEGDSMFAVFPVASDAVTAAVEMQLRPGSHLGPDICSVVRTAGASSRSAKRTAPRTVPRLRGGRRYLALSDGSG